VIAKRDWAGPKGPTRGLGPVISALRLAESESVTALQAPAR
jgi:hypothetical protein